MPPPASVKPRTVSQRNPKPLPPKLVLNAVEGWGKTTFGAHAPNPLILMARGETGYDTLLANGLAPSVAADLVETWLDLIGWLDSLIVDPQGIQSLVCDATGGFERLCHEYVCDRDFGGDFGERGFSAFQKGYDLSATEWLKALQRLETINTRHGVAIVLLGHARIKQFKNPLGADFDRYIADCHDKTWGVTSRWADAVLFGNYLTVVDRERQGKGKGVGGTSRILYTERRDAFDAKNRYRMPPEILLDGVEPAGMWDAITGFMKRQES